jgi:hypothetical protein
VPRWGAAALCCGTARRRAAVLRHGTVRCCIVVVHFCLLKNNGRFGVVFHTHKTYRTKRSENHI